MKVNRLLIKHRNSHLGQYLFGLFYTATKIQKQSPRDVLLKKVSLKILQNSQEKTCDRAFSLIKLQAETGKFIKKETLVRSFPVEFSKFLGTPFYSSGRLLLRSASVGCKNHYNKVKASKSKLKYFIVAFVNISICFHTDYTNRE